eukprot:177296_1
MSQKKPSVKYSQKKPSVKYSLISDLKSISDQFSFTVKPRSNWCIDILCFLWLISIGLGVIIVTIWFSVDNEWNADRKKYYYMILIALSLTIFFICMSFTVQYFILPAGLPKVYSHIHKQKVPVTKHNYNILSDEIDNLSEKKIAINGNNAKAALLREKKLKRNKDTNKPNCFCFQRFSLIISMIFSSDWTLFNFASMCVMIFHLFYVIISIRSIYYQFETDILLQIFYHSIRSVSDVLPGICLIFYWKAQETYHPYAEWINKFEKKLLSAENNKENAVMVQQLLGNRKGSDVATTVKRANEFKYKEHTKTLAATNSLLSNASVRVWLLCAMSFCLLYFLLHPAAQSVLFQIHMLPYKQIDPIHFVVNMCILRPFVGIVLSRSIFVTYKVTEIPKLEGIKSFLSTTIIGIILLFEWADVLFWNSGTVHFVLDIFWSSIYVITFILIIWPLKIIPGLISLSTQAAREWERFHGYRTKQPWTQWFEGLFILIIYGFYFTFSFIDMYVSNEKVYVTNHFHNIREICQMSFNLCQLVILYQLRKVECIPEMRRYVAQKKTKYIAIFKWFSVLNIIAFLYSFIFVSNHFYDLLHKDNDNYKDIFYKLSYTFSFCMQYYPLWALEQFDKWLKFHINGSSDKDTDRKAKNSHIENNLLINNNDDIKVEVEESNMPKNARQLHGSNTNEKK